MARVLGGRAIFVRMGIARLVSCNEVVSTTSVSGRLGVDAVERKIATVFPADAAS